MRVLRILNRIRVWHKKWEEIERELVRRGVAPRYAKELAKDIASGWMTMDTAVELGKMLERRRAEEKYVRNKRWVKK